MKIYLMNMSMINRVFLIFISFCLPLLSFADESNLPRFVSTKSDHVNARKGPGISYPIEWVYVKVHEPLKVVQEFEEWRRVSDIEGVSGWVHSSVISKKRYVIIQCEGICNLYKSQKEETTIVAKLENGLRCSFEKNYGSWTKIKCKNYKGYIRSGYLWGLFDSEK